MLQKQRLLGTLRCWGGGGVDDVLSKKYAQSCVVQFSADLWFAIASTITYAKSASIATMSYVGFLRRRRRWPSDLRSGVRPAGLQGQ